MAQRLALNLSAYLEGKTFEKLYPYLVYFYHEICKTSAANKRYKLFCEKVSRDQGSPSIILCTPVKFQRTFVSLNDNFCL